MAINFPTDALENDEFTDNSGVVWFCKQSGISTPGSDFIWARAGLHNVEQIDDLLDATTQGTGNTGLGEGALSDALMTGDYNTAIGFNSLQVSTVGEANTGFGAGSLAENTIGDSNTAVGGDSLRFNTTGGFNSALGRESLFRITTGSKNIGIGYGAGDAIITGSNNTVLGARPGFSDMENTVLIGSGTTQRIKVDDDGLEINGSPYLAAAIGNINNPLLDLPLTSSLAMKQGAGEVAFTRATTATYVDRYGVVKDSAIDSPRFEKEGLLIEGVSTNNDLNSQDFENASWNKSNTTIVANTTTAPDGTTTADELRENSANTEHFFQYTTPPSTTAGTLTGSLFVKASSGDRSIRLRCFDSLGFIASAYFNLATGAFYSVSPAVTASNIKVLANGWFRISVSFSTSASGGGVNVYLIEEGETDTTHQGNGTSGLYIWGKQVEQLPFCTSYIPTLGGAVTRSPDLCEATFDGNMNNSEHDLTYLMDLTINAPAVILPVTRGIIGIVNEEHRYFRLTAGQNGKYQGVGLANGYASTLESYRYGFVASEEQSSTTYLNGEIVSAGGAIEVRPIIGTRLIRIGASGHNTVDMLYGHFRNFRIYDRVLTPDEISLS